MVVFRGPMRYRFVLVVLASFGCIVWVTVSKNKTWSSQWVNFSSDGSGTISPGTVKKFNFEQTKEAPTDFEAIRQKARHDEHAIYLSKQKPPFDPDFKSPCWWYGERNQSLACVPYVFLAGFPKCGTSDLYSRLTRHPLIVRAKRKEPHYLTRTRFMTAPTCESEQLIHTSCDTMHYSRKFFDSAQMEIRNYSSDVIQWDQFHGNTKSRELFKYPALSIDGSTSTVFDNVNGHHIIRDIPLPERVLQADPSILDWVATMNPTARFVIIVREPVARLFSCFNYFYDAVSPELFDKFADEDFILDYRKCRSTGNSVLKCVRRKRRKTGNGIYYLYIQELLLRFPRDRIFIVRTDYYERNMRTVLQDIFEFLELPQLDEKAMTKILSGRKGNVNKRKVGPMLPSTAKKLAEFYQPFNIELAKLLDDDGFLWQDAYDKYTSYK